jgi:hypothetical protein
MHAKTNITLKTKVSRNPDVAWRILGDYLIAVTPADNRVHRFNETGTFIWRCLEHNALSLAVLKEKIETHFDMQGKSAEKDLFDFISETTDKGIVNIDS